MVGARALLGLARTTFVLDLFPRGQKECLCGTHSGAGDWLLLCDARGGNRESGWGFTMQKIPPAIQSAACQEDGIDYYSQ